MTYVYATAMMLAAIAAYRYRYGRIISPDGAVYLMSAAGVRVPSPFHRRLLPIVFRLAFPSIRWMAKPMSSAASSGGWPAIDGLARSFSTVWTVVSYAALAACGGLLAVYADQRGVNPLLAVALFAALPWVRLCVRMPVLTDQVGMAMALAAGCFSEDTSALVALGLMAGLINERAPVFAALFAWSPLPLIGLVTPLVVSVLRPAGPPLPWHRGILDRPFSSALERHRAAPLWVFAAPWGAALVGLSAMTWQLGVTLAVAAGQMVVATDRVRLYQTAAPVLCVAAAGVMGEWSMLAVTLALVAHVVGPQSEERG